MFYIGMRILKTRGRRANYNIYLHESVGGTDYVNSREISCEMVLDRSSLTRNHYSKKLFHIPWIVYSVSHQSAQNTPPEAFPAPPRQGAY